MARNAHKISPIARAVGKTGAGSAPMRVAESGQTGVDPVARLQANISHAFEATGDRWSPLSTSIFLLAVCGAFWAVVAFVVLDRLH